MKKKIIFFFIFNLLVNTVFSQEKDSVYTSIEEALKNKYDVKYLKLNRKHYKVFPDQIFEFTNLIELDLSKNKLTELPDSIAVLTNLKKINISQNKLTTLPSTIKYLINLEDIRAAQNEIYYLPPQISYLKKLKILDLWSNNIVDFPNEIETLSNLKELDLRGIVFTEEQQKKIIDLLPTTKIYFSPGCNCSK